MRLKNILAGPSEFEGKGTCMLTHTTYFFILLNGKYQEGVDGVKYECCCMCLEGVLGLGSYFFHLSLLACSIF